MIVCPTHVGVNRSASNLAASSARVCPTHVGVNRGISHCWKRWRSLPHARGGEPETCRAFAFGVDVCPTHVGVNRSCSRFQGRGTGLPHARGGEPYISVNHAKRATSLPHARGGEPRGNKRWCGSRNVCPTHVGVNRGWDALRHHRERLPHARGGEPRSATYCSRSRRLPHARGGEPGARLAFSRLIPSAPRTWG